MIRVAIANDTAISLEALRRAIALNSAYRLIWTASDGAQAIEKARLDPPDLILMDLLMPTVDGVAATRQIMKQSPCAILIVTASVHRNTSRVFEAMGAGALDVVKTPALGREFGEGGDLGLAAAEPLLAKMATVSAYLGKSRRGAVSRETISVDLPDLILIGASTSGPKALAQILNRMPVKREVAIVVVQHIDLQFAAGLAAWLDGQTALAVRLAKVGDRPAVGTVLLAGGEGHLVMRGDRTLAYTKTAIDAVHQPSVDMFFASVAKSWPLASRAGGKAVLLTGMGRDGAKGLLALRSANWQTIAESEESCVVYGMPRAAAELGAACEVLAVQKIAEVLARN